MLERKAGEGFFCSVAAQPRPLFFGDPESGFYARLPLRRPREEVLRFLIEALRFHRPILAQGAWPWFDCGESIAVILSLPDQCNADSRISTPDNPRTGEVRKIHLPKLFGESE